MSEDSQYPRQNRQGDVLLIPVAEEETPLEGRLPVAREEGRIILAHGEVTGHAHAIVDPNAGFFEVSPDSQDRLLRLVSNETVLRHETHGPHTLKPGLYVVRRQREYTPEAIRTVAD